MLPGYLWSKVAWPRLAPSERALASVLLSLAAVGLGLLALNVGLGVPIDLSVVLFVAGVLAVVPGAWLLWARTAGRALAGGVPADGPGLAEWEETPVDGAGGEPGRSHAPGPGPAEREEAPLTGEEE